MTGTHFALADEAQRAGHNNQENQRSRAGMRWTISVSQLKSFAADTFFVFIYNAVPGK